MNRKAHTACRNCSGRRQNLSSGAFHSKIPVWVGFGSNGKVTEFSIGKSSEYAEKSGRNQQISTGFGRSVGIRTRGLLVPKVGRIFLADISGHFRTFPLGIFYSGVFSNTDHSTCFFRVWVTVWVRTENQRRRNCAAVNKEYGSEHHASASRDLDGARI